MSTLIYVIQRDDGRYVARSGSWFSYTKNLQEAREFPTKSAAERDCCGNERVLTLDQAFRESKS